MIDGAKVGWIGEIREEVLKAFEIEQSIYCTELQFDIILQKGNFDASLQTNTTLSAGDTGFFVLRGRQLSRSPLLFRR